MAQAKGARRSIWQEEVSSWQVRLSHCNSGALAALCRNSNPQQAFLKHPGNTDREPSEHTDINSLHLFSSYYLSSISCGADFHDLLKCFKIYIYIFLQRNTCLWSRNQITTEVDHKNHQLIIQISHPAKANLFSSSFGGDFSECRVSLNLPKD